MGSLEQRQQNDSAATVWRNMTADERNSYEARAAEMECKRKEIRRQPLSNHRNALVEASALEGLSASQVKRLTGPRLDATLTGVSKHEVWRHGLGMSDHNSALRGGLVSVPSCRAAMEAMRARHDDFFGYDPAIVPNLPAGPTFMRPCATTEGGTCRLDNGHATFARLLERFDQGLTAQKLGANPVIVLLQELPGPDAPEHWMIMAGVARRPLCHSVVHLRRDSQDLMFSMQNAALHVGSMQRKLRSVLRGFCNAGGEEDQLRLRVACLDLIVETMPSLSRFSGLRWKRGADLR